jgi:hypothetical protein
MISLLRGLLWETFYVVDQSFKNEEAEEQIENTTKIQEEV